MVIDTLGDTIANTKVKTFPDRKGQKNRKFIIFETLPTGEVAGRCTS